MFGRIFGIRPEWGRDGRTGRTDGPDGRDGRDGRTGRTDGPDGRDGRDGRTEYSFTLLLGLRNTVLQFHWDVEIQFLKEIKKYIGPIYFLFVIFFNLLLPVGFLRFSSVSLLPR